MVSKRPRRSATARAATLLRLLLVPAVAPAATLLSPAPSHAAQDGSPSAAPGAALDGGRLYEQACASCHGSDGTGAPVTQVGFSDPPLPDFTDCSFASREPDADWVAVAHDAGPSGLYVASRQGNVEVMAAESPEALADNIRGAEAVVGRGHVQGTRR